MFDATANIAPSEVSERSHVSARSAAFHFEGSTAPPMHRKGDVTVHFIGHSGVASTISEDPELGTHIFDSSRDSSEIEAEHKSLITRYQALVSKGFEEELSRSEELKLNLIQWEIDQLEKARFKKESNLLAIALESKKELAANIQQLAKEIRALSR
jgi:hypothetical protein